LRNHQDGDGCLETAKVDFVSRNGTLCIHRVG